MILKDALQQIVRTQVKDIPLIEHGVEREKLKEIEINAPLASIISGIRRCGKSTLMRQLMKKTENYYYFNFEDPRALNFQADDFRKLDEVFKEECGKSDYYFFDEIQNVEKWELFVRQLLDNRKHVIITGSNASLLSKELGTRLTGRHLRYELFPFSYGEFLKMNKTKEGPQSFQEYLKEGGFPEYLKLKNAQILQELFNDIITRDIVVRHKIRSVQTAKNIALYLLTNSGKEFTYNNLKKLFELGSTNSAISFVSFFEDSYLLFTVPRFAYSLKKQLVNPKKVYSIDNGIANANSATFSADNGKMLENAVFLNLRKKYKNIYYFREKNECDFVIKEGVKVRQAIQVCYHLNEDNKDRELKGLLEALNEFKLNQGMILTFNQEDSFVIEGKKIKVIPTWKWLI